MTDSEWHPSKFEQELSRILTSKSKLSASRIDTLKNMAIDHPQDHQHICQSVVDFIKHNEPSFRLAGLYVIDAISSRAYKLIKTKDDRPDLECYLQQFALLFKDPEFIVALQGCSSSDKKKIKKTLDLWAKNGMYTKDLAEALDSGVQEEAVASTSASQQREDEPTTPPMHPQTTGHTMLHMPSVRAPPAVTNLALYEALVSMNSDILKVANIHRIFGLPSPPQDQPAMPAMPATAPPGFAPDMAIPPPGPLPHLQQPFRPPPGPTGPSLYPPPGPPLNYHPPPRPHEPADFHSYPPGNFGPPPSLRPPMPQHPPMPQYQRPPPIQHQRPPPMLNQRPPPPMQHQRPPPMLQQSGEFPLPDPHLPPNTIRVLTRSLFVGPLPIDFAENDVYGIFGRYGQLVSVVVSNNAKAQARNAFLKFSTHAETRDAKLDNPNLIIGDMHVKVNWAFGFGPRHLFNYDLGESIISLQDMSSDELDNLVTTELGGFRGQPVQPQMTIEEPAAAYKPQWRDPNAMMTNGPPGVPARRGMKRPSPAFRGAPRGKRGRRGGDH
ncbi:hypothetical protein DM01DRAFT_1404962 [Hesseltinella vesiculosa]|uniref:CID domain-containing protein n=1 Tax=Hesseltinella vesiculosa TaxID=101127 RepID=A0A1X2GQS6_9FUNG|nr:hypothetical protein DM01DRAFT_1404962 [Hesseltinella vesiculosa]